MATDPNVAFYGYRGGIASLITDRDVPEGRSVIAAVNKRVRADEGVVGDLDAGWSGEYHAAVEEYVRSETHVLGPVH